MRALLVANANDADPGFIGQRFAEHGFIGERFKEHGSVFEHCERENPDLWPSLDGADLVLLLGSWWSAYWPDIAKSVVRHTQSLFSASSANKFVIKLIVAQDNLTIGSILKIATSVLRVRPLVTISANKSGSTQPQSLVFKSVVNTNLDSDSSTGFTVGVKKVMSDLQSSFLATGWQNTSEKTVRRFKSCVRC